MTDGTTTITIPGDAPAAVELLLAVHGGDVELVSRLLSDNPDLAKARFAARGGTGTALHFVTDWPGYFPNGPEIVHLLIDAGADPNALTTGGGSENGAPRTLLDIGTFRMSAIRSLRSCMSTKVTDETARCQCVQPFAVPRS